MGNTASTSNSSSSASHHQSTSAVKLTSTPILDRVSHGPDVSIEQFRSLTPGLSNQCTKTLFKLLSASSANTTSLKSTLQSGVRLMTDGFGTSLDNLDQDEIIWKRMMEPSTNDEIRVNLINDVLDLHKEAFIQLYATNTFNFIHQKTLDYISIPVTLDSLLRWQKQQYSNLFLIISLYIERHFNSSKQSFKCIASYPQIQYEIILYTPFNRHFDLLYQASENGYAISSFEHKVMRYASSTLTLFTCIDSGSIEYTFCLFLPNQWKKECWMDDPDTVFFKSGSGIRMTVKGLPFKNSNRLVKWGVGEGGWIGVERILRKCMDVTLRTRCDWV